jgi:hypothetical protein
MDGTCFLCYSKGEKYTLIFKGGGLYMALYVRKH